MTNDDIRPIREWSWVWQYGSSLGYDPSLAKNARIYQQSVTLTAKLWPQESIRMGSERSSGWAGSLRVPAEQLPLVISLFCGGALLILLIVAILLWRCCVAPHRNKDYRVKMPETNTLPPQTVVPVLPSESAVYLDPKSGEWSVSSRVIGCWRGDTVQSGGHHWFYNAGILNPAALCLVPRSASVPASPPPPRLQVHTRPESHPSGPPRQTPSSLPHISEFYPANASLSTSVLDASSGDVCCRHYSGEGLSKTQSLPACVRSKNCPLFTSSDDPTQLYAKVNFSKKRKNRMRNDEAAIIALSKSGSQFLPGKDTDILVENEAIVVYDERTAL